MDIAVLEEVKRLKALAETGLLYARSEYDRERYSELLQIAFRLLSKISGAPADTLRMLLPAQKDYPTAKVDIRVLILSADNKVLLVQESADGKWSLPGGWADIGSSPKETAVKEAREETGLDIIPDRLLAVFDKKMHAHPPQPFYVYKLVFWGRPLSSVINKGFVDVQYFDIGRLPPLSEDRILKSQIELVYEKALEAGAGVYVD